MTLYGLYSRTAREFLTYTGRVLTHDSRPEMEWLFPGACVREVPASFPPDQCIPIAHHPGLSSIEWPLTKEQFR